MPLEGVEKVVRAVEITPLPGAPEGVLGVISVVGAPVPVFNLRARFGLPNREMRISDHLAIVRTSRRTLALLVDAPTDVITLPTAEITTADPALSHTPSLSGSVQLADGIVLVHDLERLLSSDDERALDHALPDPERVAKNSQHVHVASAPAQ